MRRSVATVLVVSLFALAITAVASVRQIELAFADEPEFGGICLAVPPHAKSTDDEESEINRAGIAIASLYDALDAPPDYPAAVIGMGRLVRIGVFIAFGRYMFDQLSDDQKKISLDVAQRVYDAVTKTEPQPQEKPIRL